MDRLLPAIAAAFTACVLAAFAASSIQGLWRPDAFDYAQIARELYAGNGFTSRQAIYLLHLEFLAERGGLDGAWPTLHRFPLPSLAIAACYAVMGVGVAAVVAYGIVFHALTSGLVFAWGRAASGLPVACAATLLVTFNAAMLETAPSGLAEPPVIFFFTLSLYGLWLGREREGVGPALLSGAALGLAALARTNALFAAPVFLWVLASRRRQRELGIWCLALLVVLAPWLVRNTLVAGSPFFSLHSYFLLPAGTLPDGWKWDLGQRWVREFVPPLQFVLENPGPVFAKWSTNLMGLLRDAPTLAETLGLPLVALAALLPLSPARGLRRPAQVLFGGFVLNAAFVSFTDIYFDKYYYLYLPGLALLASAFVWNALGRIETPSARGSAFVACVLVMANLPAVLAAGDSVRRQRARFDSAQLEFVRDHTDEAAIVMSDFSYAVTWATGRRSVRTHYDRLPDGATILATGWIEDHYLPIDAVYLSREFTAGPGRSRTLRDTLERDARFRASFPVVHRFPDGALFFARAPR
jgi:4-amino-4-deoxy-L-arabinose transferase-like glycosyltransferase